MSELLVNTIKPRTGDSVTITGLQGSNVLEQFLLPATGASITLDSGTYTSENVTALQDPGSSYVDVTGSSITYTPPAEANWVIYKFYFHAGWQNNSHGIQHFKFFIDSDEVTRARMSLGATYYEDRVLFEWPIQCKASSADTSVGAQTSWTSAKTMKMQSRDYTNGGYNIDLHATSYFNGAGSQQFVVPLIGITALK